MKFVQATCPGGGASLELADHLQSATCPNCGSKVLIEWETKQNPAAYWELAKRFIQATNHATKEYFYDSSESVKQ